MISQWKARIKGINWRSNIEGNEDSKDPYFDCQTHLIKRDENDILPSVHQHANGLWWFYTETGADEFGGYVTKEECEESAARYAELL